MTDPELILDFYSGPRGWSEGLRLLGLADVGIEWDHTANLTAIAAGHAAIQADCTTWPVVHLRGGVRLVIGSPPCTAFSMAGKGDGREHLDELVTAMRTGDWYAPIREREPVTVWAPLDMGRIIEDCWPEAIALEQVPPCLPLWEALAVWLRAHGYSVWVSVVNAADYGVPQTRRRAVLLASRVRPMTGPVPTHDRDPQPTLFGPELQHWVSMAQALGWSGRVGFPRLADDQEATADGYRARDFRTTDEPSFALSGKTRSWTAERESEPNAFDLVLPMLGLVAELGTYEVRLSPGLTHTEPNRRRYGPEEAAPALAFGNNAGAWLWQFDRRQNSKGPGWRDDPTTPTVPTPLIPETEPAPTITGTAHLARWRERRNDQSGSGEVDPDWPLGRPATTLAGRDLVTDPGANANRFNGAEKSRNDGYRITLREALILQSFRPDHPVRGSRTAGFQQVGNAVPPRLAAHLCASVLGLDPPCFDPHPVDEPGDIPAPL